MIYIYIYKIYIYIYLYIYTTRVTRCYSDEIAWICSCVKLFGSAPLDNIT